MEGARRVTLLKAIRGKSFRRALKAISELYAGGAPGLADLVDEPTARDEQRAAQLRVARIVLSDGVRGLVEQWPVPSDPHWRAELVSEIDQSMALWTDEALADLMLAALEDVSRDVRVKAVWALLGIVRSSVDRLKSEHRSRATRAIVAMLDEHQRAPYPVLKQFVEILGHTGTRDDATAIALLEGLRSAAGEPHQVAYERLDPTKLAWYERLVAERKSIAQERVKLRISYQPTGLLDEKLLDAALKRIREQD